MPQNLSIEYHPAFSHDVVKTLLFFLAIVSVLDCLMTLTTYIRYGNFSPFEFHLAPISMILIFALKIRLTEHVKGQYTYQILLFNCPVFKRRFTSIVRASRGKLVTLLGKNREGTYKTFMTESAPIANAYFDKFTHVTE